MTNEHPSPEGAQDEALRLADALEGGKLIDDSTEWADTLHAAAAMLRSLHIEATEQARLLGISAEREMALRARVQELERELSSIGAGGVEPLRQRVGAASMRSPACWCQACDVADNGGWPSRMSICPSCGDKRCPRAEQHDNPCRARGAQGESNG